MILLSPQAATYHQPGNPTNGIMLGHSIAPRILYFLHILSGEGEESKEPANQSNITAAQKGRSESGENTAEKGVF